MAAVDCGTVVNPDIVVQQAQSTANFGLSAALTGKITIKDGRVEQNNFYDYTVLHMADAPSFEVHVVSSSEKPNRYRRGVYAADSARGCERRLHVDGQTRTPATA